MVHLVLGLIMVGLGIWGVIAWWSWFGLVMRGVVPFCLLLFGLVAILASCRRTEGSSAEQGTGHEPSADDFSGIPRGARGSRGGRVAGRA